MSKLVLLAALTAVALAGGALRTPDNAVLLTEEQVAEINAKATTWTADYNLVKGMTKDQAKSMLGTHLQASEFPEMDWGALLENFQAPDSFDARKKWPKCVNYIRDQQNCGSCWAFGASEALSDRFCIKGKKVLLSPEYMVACNTDNYGCDGGYLDVAWKYLKDVGIPTDVCVSYKSGSGVAGTCPKACDNSKTTMKLYKAKSIKSFTTVASIQAELMLNGPIEVAFDVYEDFMAYTGGIYTQVSQQYAGGHAVKLVGWGIENGVNYWICANSWTTYWGEAGYFRIAFGQVGIDSNGIAGVPVL